MRRVVEGWSKPRFRVDRSQKNDEGILISKDATVNRKPTDETHENPLRFFRFGLSDLVVGLFSQNSQPQVRTFGLKKGEGAVSESKHLHL